MIRETVADRYEVVRRLGSGGMGSVYLVRDEALGREAALKVLYEGHAGSREFIERFRREARSAASLSHPNIVAVFDAGEDGAGVPYMAMEYVPGGTLKERISERGALPARSAAATALQVACALEEAHASGIIHRDIKPENILITENGDVKVADFGIARAAEATAMTQTSQILGTVSYLSPEQARGEPVGPASDLYSLGVVLYEMLTGEVPFRSESPIATAMQHVTREPVPPRALNPRVPEALDAITMRLLAKRPEARHPGAAALREDLERFLDGRPLAAADVTASIPAAPALARTRRRRRSRLALFAAVPLVALALPVAAGIGDARPFGGVLDRESDAPVSRATMPAMPSGDTPQPQPPKPVQKEEQAPAQDAAEPEVAVVPDLTGMTVAEAEAALSAEGLLLGEVGYAYSASVPEGVVLSQDAAPGYEAQPGATVNLTASAGPAPAPQPQVQETAPPATEAPEPQDDAQQPEREAPAASPEPNAPVPQVEPPEVQVPEVQAPEVEEPEVPDVDAVTAREPEPQTSSRAEAAPGAASTGQQPAGVPRLGASRR